MLARVAHIEILAWERGFRMTTARLCALTTGILLLAAAGCATNPIVGDGVIQSGRFYGDVGITGHNGNLTIERGSKVTKLSIIGDGNNVTVQDGVTLYRIEFFGNGNTVSIPNNLSLLWARQVGTNEIIRRPATPPTPVEIPEPLRAMPEPEPPPPTDMSEPPPASESWLEPEGTPTDSGGELELKPLPPIDWEPPPPVDSEET
jgi:hypothetical protein